jgi:hypothetical protein
MIYCNIVNYHIIMYLKNTSCLWWSRCCTLWKSIPSIFSRPFLGHKAIFLTCVGYANIDVMCCCCCALMYMCLSCVDIGQLLAFLECLVYQHIQTHYIYMFDCHGSVPLVAHGWNRGHAISISFSLYIIYIYTVYITCMYRYIRILILTII